MTDFIYIQPNIPTITQAGKQTNKNTHIHRNTHTYTHTDYIHKYIQ